MKWITFCFAGLVLSLVPAIGSDRIVRTAVELESAVGSAAPGDTIVMSAGDWRDLAVSLHFQGSPEAPVRVKAEVPGQTRLTGRVHLDLSGFYGCIEGIRFERAVAVEGADALVTIGERAGSASGFRMTQCAFLQCNPAAPGTRYHWIRMYGHGHRIDHNVFSGQSHSGVTVQVVANEDSPEHRIDHNLFTDRSSGAGNGFEMIQIGQSPDSQKRGGCQVERNWFVRCDGETEIVSSKTNENEIRANLFYDCSGTVTLRHGRRSVVADNTFIGAGKSKSGGVRVIASGHRVVRNRFEGLTGRTGGVVVLYCGIPDSPLNGYFPADDTGVEDNLFVGNSGNGIYLNGGFGRKGRTLVPKNGMIRGNVWMSQDAGVVAIAGVAPRMLYEENQYTGSVETGIMNPDGLIAVTDRTGIREVGPREDYPARQEVGPGWWVELPDLALIDPAQLGHMVRDDTDLGARFAREVMARAEAVLARGTVYAVNANEKLPPSGNAHDYYSTGPYWWPDPASPDGLPYIRRDGEFNPERDLVSDREPLRGMVNDVRSMALAYAVSGEERFARWGHHLVAVWFLDPETAMTPHLAYAQAVPGRSTGRGTGIIDAHPFADLVDALVLLETSPEFPKGDAAALRRWFADYLAWMLRSENGREERAAANNHGTAYDLQATALMWYLNFHDMLREYLRNTVLPRIGAQIQPDGAQPRELTRTRSWSYSTENLEYFFKLGLIAKRIGVDLFGYEAPSGASLRGALDFVLPAACDHAQWRYPQTTAWSESYLNAVLAVAAGVYEKGGFEDKRACLESADNALEAYMLRPAK